MQLLFRAFGQRPRLETWEARPFAAGAESGPGPADRRDAYEREVGVEPPGPPEPDGPFRLAATEILGFRVFPPRIVTGVLRREPVEVGDTVGICYHFVPGVDLFFAGRVTGRFDGEQSGLWRAGFSYRTVDGHPELGEETFCAEKDLATGRVVVALRSWSRAGTWLAWAGYPITRRLQVGASRAALDHLARAARVQAAPA